MAQRSRYPVPGTRYPMPDERRGHRAVRPVVRGRQPTDYEGALRACASVGGDVDTTCAIVGGIVAARVGTAGIPLAWRESTETLPAWFRDDEAGR